MPKYRMKPEDEPMQYCGHCGLPCIEGDFCDQRCAEEYKQYLEDINFLDDCLLDTWED